MTEGLRSGQVAHAAAVNLETLRYYERRGLLPAPQRSLGGHRLYPRSTVARLRVIKSAQRLGFTLDEVAELLDLGLRTRVAAKLDEIEARISDLQLIRNTLQAALLAGCDDLVACSKHPSCPIPFAGLTEAQRSATSAQ
ncbi:MAG TPA: MerR family transcriptional regulator [Jatrophihabitantaceae bacterium]